MKEKSPQEKNAAERQVSLITEALSKAADNKGVWLNEQGKQYPRFYPKGAAVSPFNALVMGLNSDKNGFSTNLYIIAKTKCAFFQNEMCIFCIFFAVSQLVLNGLLNGF